ncbi:HTH-type transcriptional repressor PurR [Roseibium sp. TrichSKD4]|nr:HTH-type transcriptional repressor PurR [Roseibium sp. TrichSKD4]
MGLKEFKNELRDWRLDGDGTAESGRAVVERLFIKGEVPTAFFCFNDNISVGVISTLQLRGYRIPDDFSVIGFDDIPFASNFSPGLTTIRQPRQRIGELGMNLLLDTLSNRTMPSEIHKLRDDLIVRNSCASTP